MRRFVPAAFSALLLSAVACEKLPPPFGKRAADTAAVAAAPAAPTTPAAMRAPVEAQPPAPPPPAFPPRVDEPWTPIDTGTIAPGMSRMEVIAWWGVPLAERRVGDRTYLYFRNGCEVTCGTQDVVILEQNRVVDAIVRGPGHQYSGVSSSPPGQAAAFTPPREGSGGDGEADP